MRPEILKASLGLTLFIAGCSAVSAETEPAHSNEAAPEAEIHAEDNLDYYQETPLVEPPADLPANNTSAAITPNSVAPVYDNQNVINDILVPRLPSVGLELVSEAEQGINTQEQFIVTADSECAAQFFVDSDKDTDKFTVGISVFGLRKYMTNLVQYQLDGSSKSKTGHADPGFIARAHLFDPSKEGSVEEALSYLRNETNFVCDYVYRHKIGL